MLSVLQTNLHWKRWKACVEANDWVMERGRLSKDSARTMELSCFHRYVWTGANQIALQEHRAVAADDLRHASYLVATTKVPGWSARARPVDSMKDLGNREFSRWLVLINLLIEPANLDALMKWDHPEQCTREMLIASLKKAAPESTLRAIAGNAFGTHDWESGTDAQLTWLRRKVGEREKKWNKPVEAAREYVKGPF